MKRLFHWRPTLVIFTDGSSKAGIGSWAFIISKRGKIIAEKSGSVRRAGSNGMEFQAAVEALSSIPESSSITLFSDSKILIDAMTSEKWPKVLLPQIRALHELSVKHKITWQWVKAHNGNQMNERCDQLCILARQS